MRSSSVNAQNKLKVFRQENHHSCVPSLSNIDAQTKERDANSLTGPSSSSCSLHSSFALEPLLPKKLHTKSQDKLDRDEPERERKEKKKEKRNSKHQEIYDKEMKTTEIPLQPAEAVILSETVLKK